MLSIYTLDKAQKLIATNARARRLQMELTQEGLSNRSGVSLPTLRRFERTGEVSMASYLKLQLVLGGLEDIVGASAVKQQPFATMDEVLDTSKPPTRKYGRRK